MRCSFYFSRLYHIWISEIKLQNKTFWINIRTKNNFKSIQKAHQNFHSSDFKRRYHLRKEIIRNYQRDLPAIKAAQRKEVNEKT